jgi:16S rRNA U1498 N3-methylase RsmE
MFHMRSTRSTCVPHWRHVPVIEYHIQPAFREFMEDKIDAAELEKRKAAARQAAEQTRATLIPLDQAFTEYEEMVQRRVKLEEELEKAIEEAHKMEDAAEQRVQAMAAKLLTGS